MKWYSVKCFAVKNSLAMRISSCVTRSKFPAACFKGTRRSLVPACTAAKKYAVHICTGKVCKKQGSQQVLKFASDLGFSDLEVASSGCLGKCGKGPNALLLPGGVVVHHVATPNDFAELVQWQFGLKVPPELMKALELRMVGNMHARDGKLSEAISSYTQALELLEAAGVNAGCHMLFSNRSVARLTLGQKQEALQDAKKAVEYAPPGWHTAWVRLIDAHYALEQYAAAASAVQQAVQADRTFKSTPEYKVITQALQGQGQKVN